MINLKQKIKKIYLRSILKAIPISLTTKNVLFDQEKIKLDKCFCVINFDDLSPVPDGNDIIGRGGSINDEVTIRFEKLMNMFPELGVTHFVIPNHIINDRQGILDKGKFAVNDERNQTWTRYFLDLKKKYNIEFACHGLSHRQFNNFLFARHTEFAYLTLHESIKRLEIAKKKFTDIGIETIGFRPPGWDINSDLSIVEALKLTNFKYAALSSYDGGLNSNTLRIEHFHPTKINGIINFPDNINLDWPIEKMIETIEQIIKEGGLISIKGHFTNDTLTNSFSETNFEKLIHVLSYLKSDHNDDFEFGTFKDVYNSIIKV